MNESEELIEQATRLYEAKRTEMAKRFGVKPRVLVVSSSLQENPLCLEEARAKFREFINSNPEYKAYLKETSTWQL